MIHRYLFLISFFLFGQVLKADYSFSYFNNPKYSEDFKSFDYVNSQAPKGGTLKIGTVGSFNSINPFILSGQSADGLYLTFDSLMQKSKDELGSTYPLIAESIAINQKKSAIEFKLNHKAKFHDGSPLTASDVKFTFDILKAQGHPRYKIIFREILDIKTIDQDKIIFKLEDIRNKDLIIQITQIPILSKNYFKNHDFSKTTTAPILGSGPYKIADTNPGKSITYSKVTNYWAKDLPVNIGLFNFEKIKYKYYRDSNVAIRALKAKEYDFRYENIAKNWANEYNNIPNLNKELINHNIPVGMQCFTLNNRLTKFQDINLRKALNLAFDFEWTNKNLFFDSYIRTNSFFENSVFKATNLNLKTEQEILNSLNYTEMSVLDIKYISASINDASGYNRNSLKQAQNILLNSGYKIINQQLFPPESNKPLQIEFLINSPSFKRVILPFIKNLNKLGINASIKLVDSSIYQKKLENFDFDITVNVFPRSIVPGNELYSYLHSKNKDINGSNNLAGIANDTIDIIVETIPSIDNYDLLKTYTSLLDKMLLNNYYVIPHWYINAFRIVYWDNIEHPIKNPEYDLCLECWFENK